MLVIKEEAVEEIRQAQLWYEVQRPGLGVKFRHSLQECLRFIEADKPGYAIRRKPYRPARVGKFLTSSGMLWKARTLWFTVCAMVNKDH